MKKKTLVLVSVLVSMLIINSVAFAMTGSELQSLCDPDDAEIIAQYLNLNADYPVITELALESDDEVIYKAVVVVPNGEEYIVVVVNGTIHIMKA
jgi:hypothetical protein